MQNLRRTSRKEFLKLVGAAAFLPSSFAQNQPAAIVGKRPMILRNEYPEDLETPLEAFGTWLTPNDAFFVRQHLPRPKVNVAEWRLKIRNLSGKTTELGIAELRRMAMHTVPATLECTGNNRSYFQPIVPGLQWTKGGIGNAEWRGVTIADILKAAGAQGGKHVHINGADVGVAKTPDFIRSMPMRKALHPDTLVALFMNGEPVPEINGGPLRLVVPGWNGASWVKWVTELTESEEEEKGFYMNPAYRYPKVPLPPGTAAKPEDLAPLERMPVKSFIFTPANGAKASMAALDVRGIAWSGERRITRVEISSDRGVSWHNVELGKEDFPSAWRLWRYRWTPERPGYHLLMCRATDDAGATQPLDAVWNPSGYLSNAVDRVGVEVA